MDTEGGGGVGAGEEEVRLKTVELVLMSRCFCVDATVGRGEWWDVGGEAEEDEEEEQFESVVFERDKVAESFVSLLIGTAIVCIAESVSLSTFGCVVPRL